MTLGVLVVRKTRRLATVCIQPRCVDGAAARVNLVVGTEIGRHVDMVSEDEDAVQGDPKDAICLKIGWQHCYHRVEWKDKAEILSPCFEPRLEVGITCGIARAALAADNAVLSRLIRPHPI